MRQILPECLDERHPHYCFSVRLSEFWQRMEARFGSSYAHSLAADYRVTTLGATVNEAIERGEEPKVVWRAVCQEFDVARKLR